MCTASDVESTVFSRSLSFEANGTCRAASVSGWWRKGYGSTVKRFEYYLSTALFHGESLLVRHAFQPFLRYPTSMSVLSMAIKSRMLSATTGSSCIRSSARNCHSPSLVWITCRIDCFFWTTTLCVTTSVVGGMLNVHVEEVEQPANNKIGMKSICFKLSLFQRGL
jgi:hypothetical protein